MSPRIKRLRKISNPPIIRGLKPYGISSEEFKQEEVKLLYEEYEALRLCDYDMLNHHQASIRMGVSRPTFTRIYATALQKIAKAMVEGREIQFESGTIYFDSNWYHCDSCGCYFNNPEKDNLIENCSLCGSSHIEEFDYEEDKENNMIGETDELIICTYCGYEQNLQHVKPRGRHLCPKCHNTMRINGNSYGR